MIMRVWRGWTSAEDRQAYADYINETGIPAYLSTPGNRGAYLVSRTEDDRVEFLTISLWKDYESIEAFAGEDISRAVFYPEDERFLVDRETTVSHFEVHS